MMQGGKGHGFYACMRIHEFGPRKNMRKKPDRADFEYFQIARA